MKVAIYTLGCKMNQYETQAMEQLLRQRGHEVVEFTDAADVYVVNTCSVTAVSDRNPARSSTGSGGRGPAPCWRYAGAIPRPTRRKCGGWMWI